MSSRGLVYVPDSCTYRINIFDSTSGNHIRDICESELRNPGGLALDEKKNLLYVLDDIGIRVNRLSAHHYFCQIKNKKNFFLLLLFDLIII